MKLHKSLVISLLAAGSLVTGSAQAQDLLFSATMGPKIANSNSVGFIYALGSQKETFGFLIHTITVVQNPAYTSWAISQSGPQPFENSYTNTVKIFSVDGKELKNVTGTFSSYPPNAYQVEVGVEPIEGGSFVLKTEVAADQRTGFQGSVDTAYYSRVQTDWLNTKPFPGPPQLGGYFNVSVSGTSTSPTGIFAAFKDNGTNYVADVYATDKAALTPPAPVPTITSDLGLLDLKRNKTIQPYATKANVPVKDYFAKGLPPGLKINPVTGEISGKPTTKGSFSASIGATPLVGSPFSDNKIFRVK